MVFHRTPACIAALAFFFACATGHADRAAEVLVKFQAGTPLSVIEQFIGGCGGSTTYCSAHTGVHAVAIPDNASENQLIDYFSSLSDVVYAEPNGTFTKTLLPDDTYYVDARNFQWNMKYIGMPAAWDLSGGGSASTIVAIVDTGVAYENYGVFRQAPDLVGTTFVQGYDFVNDDNHPNDDDGHGTHVAGTIAQTTNNAYGVAGIAFNTAIMPVKVLDSTGSGTFADVADGIIYAADHGANVINLSLGASVNSLTVQNAVNYAHNLGVTLVCAAGNSGASGPAAIIYPARYAATIAVGATRWDNTVTYYSNEGPQLDLVAPGGDTSVDQDGNGYVDGILQNDFNPVTLNYADFGFWFFQGTSMATPHVAAVAALLYDMGVRDPEVIRCILQATAIDLYTAGFDETSGHGLLNAAGALMIAQNWPFPGDANGDGKVDSADLSIWQQNYDPVGFDTGNNAFANADFNGDGKVDSSDLALWQQNYNPSGFCASAPSGGAPASSASIPEPDAMWMILGWLPAIRFFIRRKTA